MKTNTIINLRDKKDGTYMVGFMGEGWTTEQVSAHNFYTRFGAWLIKVYALIFSGLYLEIVTKVEVTANES